jgi:hypothetical protein
LLLWWLLGQFAATGSSAASYQQAEEPVSQRIDRSRWYVHWCSSMVAHLDKA